MILLIDNYDSFAHNLARYVEILGHSVQIVRNDQIDTAEILVLAPEAIIISPGPCGPKQAGVCLDVVEKLGPSTPLLGVCLGHQCIAETFGSFVEQSSQPIHGKASTVYHAGSQLFNNVPSPFEAGRYHSLTVNLDPNGPLKSTAATGDGVVMAIEHTTYPVYGVQFHPESILTQHGGTIMENFLSIANLWNNKNRVA